MEGGAFEPETNNEFIDLLLTQLIGLNQLIAHPESPREASQSPSEHNLALPEPHRGISGSPLEPRRDLAAAER